ncbi:MAG: Fe-S-binding domain-containing protein, partial [Chloroflexota bacterium]
MNILFGTLTVVTFFPLLGAIVLLFVPKENKDAIRWIAVVTSLITFLLSLIALSQFNPSFNGMQLVVRAPWIKVGSQWSMDYFLGVDGASILMVLLTTFLTPIAIFSSWTAIEDRVKEYMILFLLLEVGMLGVFVALDLFLFYIFWEFSLVPMY